MAQDTISHAIVLPERDFQSWFQVVQPYSQAFEKVAIIRSLAGVDLNKYRDITAITIPGMWFQDDPLLHLRRFYRKVVRVDVVNATTPSELEPLLRRRITNNDRYGVLENAPVHIFDRFVLDWATDARPLRILQRFRDQVTGDPLRGTTIATFPDSKIVAAADGVVTKIFPSATPDEFGYGQYIQIQSLLNGDVSYQVSYIGVRDINVTVGQAVETGDQIGMATGDQLKFIVQPILPTTNQPSKDASDPTPMFYVQNMRVRPTIDGLRLRTFPDVEGSDVVGQVYQWYYMDALDTHGRTLNKLGREDEWILVRTHGGKEGYTAAWYLEARIEGEIANKFPNVNPNGVNLDIHNEQGSPNPSLLGQMGWVRINYNVSRAAGGVGSEDLDAAYRLYHPMIKKYADAGYKVLLVFTHETYGEGRDEFWPWYEMTDLRWNLLTGRFSSMLKRIAQQYVGKNLVHCWQIWNEQDAEIRPNSSSVSMPPHNYAHLLAESIKAIRSIDPAALVIPGGLTGGPGRGSAYIRSALQILNRSEYPDGIAFHPYGRGVDATSPYAPFGSIDDSMNEYGAILPEKPVWITEWGVLDRKGDSPVAVSAYAQSFVKYMKRRYPGRVASMIWYAWSHTMHNGYGLVQGNGQPQPDLYQTYIDL